MTMIPEEFLSRLIVPMLLVLFYIFLRRPDRPAPPVSQPTPQPEPGVVAAATPAPATDGKQPSAERPAGFLTAGSIVVGGVLVLCAPFYGLGMFIIGVCMIVVGVVVRRNT